MAGNSVTSAAATGIVMAPDTNDNMSLFIEIDVDMLAASDYRYVRAVLTDLVDSEACLVSGHAFLEARYKQTTHISATASASS